MFPIPTLLAASPVKSRAASGSADRSQPGIGQRTSDSRNLLDRADNRLENSGMTKPSDPSENLSVVVLERVVSRDNISRYYVLSVEPTLFGEMSLTREWGRIGQRGGRIVALHGTAGSAREELPPAAARFSRPRIPGHWP